MSPNPPIVPSRNALRALRRLACGGSTIIGAVGCIFTVVGISCDTHRRVLLAERLIETKRTIRSVSNSNGAAHVARMFEAAEKGEDFGLDITRSRKRNIRRDYSSPTIENTKQQNATEIGPGGSHQPLVVDETDDTTSAKTGSPSQKNPVPLLQRSTRISARSLSSSRGVKILPDAPVAFDQPQWFGERRWRKENSDSHIQTYDHAQAFPELSYSGPPGPGRTLFESHSAKQELLGAAAQKGGILTDDTLHQPRQGRDPVSGSAENHSAVEKILVSTQQHHKLHDHGVYSRPGKKPVARRGQAGASSHKDHALKINSSAAEKIVAATQQQHKLHSHAVYGRPSKTNTEVHARLNEHVALWLNSDGKSRSHSELKYDSDCQTGLPLGRGNNLIRSSSTFPRDTLNIRPLRRKFSISANKTEAALDAFPTENPSLRQGSRHESLEQLPRPFQPVGGHLIAPWARGTIQPVPADNQRTSTRSECRVRQVRVGHWSRRYSSQPLHSSEEQISAQDANQQLAPDEREVPRGKLSSAPIALDLQIKPWPASVSNGEVIPENSSTEGHSPKPSQLEDNRMQHAESSVVNDLSEPSSRVHVSTFTVPGGLLERRSDVLFEFDGAFDECVSLSKTMGYAVWDKSIRKTVEEHGTSAGKQFWLKAMAYYAAPGDTRDWYLLDHLHKSFHKIFWRPLPPYLDFDSGRLLTRHVLETAPTSQRAAELLFPLASKEVDLETDFATQGMTYSAVQKSRNLYANASKCLKDLWDEDGDVEKAVSELRKILRIAKLQNIELAEDLFFGTIRRLSSNGQIQRAQALFDEMVYYHQIEPSFLTRSVLVCGHARAGDWDRVAKEIEAMHNIHNLSRREPLGYSLMFNNVLSEYASRRSIAQTHDFLVHALGYWGLVPTSAISATAIQAFLAHRRFDLVREWVEAVRVLFPQVDTETSRFAWHLGSVWEDINASCVEVEETCKALCYRKDASKVQASFKEMVRLALARDLANKLHAAEAAKGGSKKNDNFPLGSPWALNHLLERAQSFAPDTSTGVESQKPDSREARELLSQVESVARLDKLFGTEGRITNAPSLNVHESPHPRSSQDTTEPALAASLESPVPADLMRDILPSLGEVERLLGQHYSVRQAKGLSTNHAILKYTCQKLRKHDRKVDAMQLLKATFEGPYVQGPMGVMFDLAIMEMWLRFAYEAKSLSHCLVVFWAVLDAGEDYALTSKFVLLANMCYHKLRLNRFAVLARTNPSKHEELEYLLSKLRRKLWANNDGASPTTDKSRSAEFHKMRKGMRRKLIVGRPRMVEVSG